MLKVAALLGIPQAAAATVVNIIIGGGTLATVLILISTILSAGATSLLLLSWSVIKAEVLRRAALYGTASAVLY